MTWLLDGNVLVALRIDSHVHHDRVHRWFAGLGQDRFATCIFTQATLVRVHMKWGDSLSSLKVPHRHLQGGAQVTDAWLAEIVRRRKWRLATLRALATLHSDVAVLLPL